MKCFKYFHVHCIIIFLQIAWALNKGIKAEFKQYWDVELGVTYVPWSKVKMEDLDVFREGGMLDPDTLAPGKFWNYLVIVRLDIEDMP